MTQAGLRCMQTGPAPQVSGTFPASPAWLLELSARRGVGGAQPTHLGHSLLMYAHHVRKLRRATGRLDLGVELWLFWC